MRQFTETIHSDFLIHWTGKDIDENLQPDWNAKKSSITNDKKIVNAYLERFKNILKYGLWMTRDDAIEMLRVNRQNPPFEIPSVPRICFTELKLSEARKHAQKFGRLGIGVKRYFLFDRMGSPLIYIQFETENIFFPHILIGLIKQKMNMSFIHFLNTCVQGVRLHMIYFLNLNGA